MSSKYSGKLLDDAKQSAKDALKTASKIVIKKNSRSNWCLSGNKIPDKITSLKNSETNTHIFYKQPSY